MNPYMVVAAFKPGTEMNEVLKVVADEQARVGELQAEGKVRSIYLATAARQTVFLKVFASDHSDAEAIVQSLPMAKWWDLDIYPLNPPANPTEAS